MGDLRLGLAARDPRVATLPALIVGSDTFSFAALAARAAALAGALASEGVGPGSRVALLADNRVETVVAIHALLDLGAAIVPLHPRLTEAEIQVILADVAPHRVLRGADVAGPFAPAPAPAPARPLDPESPLAIVYTSGTTGRPKGAVLPRRAFLAAAAASAANLGWTAADRWLLCMPLCHVGGLSVLTRCLAARRPVILEPRFDPDRVLAAIEGARATLLSVVPTMLAALLERDRHGVLPRLRATLVGGAACPPALLDECARRGVLALTTYGLTEACSQVTAQRPRPPHAREPGSGAPLPGVELRVEAGRIQVRGPTLMQGYFGGESSLDAEGWFDTGDLGELDVEGRLHVHARCGDLVVTGGENVYPVEVEQCLEAIPGVRRALVFGVPDARWGQLVAAAIEVDAPIDASRLQAALAARLAPHKRPRLVGEVVALPLTASGKLVRNGAAARYEAALRPLATSAPPAATPGSGAT